eukprot:TRINITY_DN15816_c0_g1_i1.p1 TRINITY_DN15816_c0_g1~~TRINITY_DN15816_c0_g1_i1.p1  ORF type:complete len:232 (+),score=43.63 TRINITY_DN15816_c0_g1_i1:47-742(+)
MPSEPVLAVGEVKCHEPREEVTPWAPLPESKLEELEHASQRCQHFVAWLLSSEIEVVVWDMDQTMGAGHCGEGILRSEMDEYIAAASPDFVEAITVLARLPGIRMAVATNSDPAEYELPGKSRESHILGPDLATELIKHWCPEALPKFEVIFGFYPELPCHRDVPRLPGKSVHMRHIANHYGVQFRNMVLIDDSVTCLENEDGWAGVLVRDVRVGFRFEDCISDDIVQVRV